MFSHKNTNKTFFRNMRIRILAVIVVTVLCATSVFGATVNSYTVTVNDGDSVLSVKTSAQDPMDILSQADVTLGENDLLDYSAFIPGENSSLTVRRAFPVTVVDADNNEKTVMTAQATVADLLEQMNISVGNDDILNYELGDALRPNMRLQIKRTFLVTVVEDGKSASVRVKPGSIWTNLLEAGYDINRYDVVFPTTSQTVHSGMVINIDRAKEVYRTETKDIPFNVVTEKSDALEQGKTKTLQKGQVGTKSIIYKDVYVKGEVVSTVAVSEAVSREPVEEKRLVGTKKPVSHSKPSGSAGSSGSSGSSNMSNASKGAISTLTPPDWLMIDENGVPNKYRYILRGESTAYYAPKGSLTSTGKKARLGYIAVDPREIPYGTEMYIVSQDGKYVYGYCIAADTGGFIYNSNTICDLYFGSLSDCQKFGRRNVVIYVL